MLYKYSSKPVKFIVQEIMALFEKQEMYSLAQIRKHMSNDEFAKLLVSITFDEVLG